MPQSESRFRIKKFMGDDPFSYTTKGAFHFTATRCDFCEGVVIHLPRGQKAATIAPADMAKHVAEAIGYHAAAILPNLNGFRGYEDLSFAFVEQA